MIKSIHIENFQSHRNSTLDLSPGLNVIVGPSDSGKTAIIRALRWVVFNRPLGSSICSNWGGTTRVVIATDKHEVIKTRKKGKMYYRVGQLTLQATGADVPEQIRNVLKLGEINFQLQLDPPFLLSKSPGEVAKHFNSVAQLQTIDLSLSNINAWIREAETDIKRTEQQVKELEEKVKELDYVDAFEKRVLKLEKLQTKLSGIKADIVDATDLIDSWEDIKVREQRLSRILQAEQDLDELERIQTQLNQVKAEEAEIERTIQDLEFIRNRMKQVKEHLNELYKQIPNVCPFCGQPIEDKRRIA